MVLLTLASTPSIAWAASIQASKKQVQANANDHANSPIALSASPRPNPKAMRMNRCGAVYRVKSGDTLRSIAKKCGVSIWRLRLLNGLKRTKLRPGQVLRLKKSRVPRLIKPTPTPPVPTLKQALPTPVYYRKNAATR